jgi:hypothetical protein
MTAFVTPDEARKEWLCPLARTFGPEAKKGDHCSGNSCAIWRWKPPMATDPEFMVAIKREMMNLATEHQEATGKQRHHSTFHAEAVKRVSRNPSGFGISPELGFCGLGGKPS